MDCSLPDSSVHGVTSVGHGLATKPLPPPPWVLRSISLSSMPTEDLLNSMYGIQLVRRNFVDLGLLDPRFSVPSCLML